MGDLNQDNKINTEDITILNKYILCEDNISYDSYILSDLNFDGVVDCFDLVKMRQLLIENNKSSIAAVMMRNYILSGTYSDYITDLTGDGVIDIFDLVLMKKQIIDSGF